MGRGRRGDYGGHGPAQERGCLLREQRGPGSPAWASGAPSTRGTEAGVWVEAGRGRVRSGGDGGHDTPTFGLGRE